MYRMTITLAVALLCVVSCSAQTYVGEHQLRADNLPELLPFLDWVTVFRANGTNNQYASPEELQTRRGIYETNLASIRAHNLQADAGIHTHRQGVNQFSDLTPQEFKSLVSSPFRTRTPAERTHLKTLDATTAPAAVDWRTKGAVTPVKNQGSCGSCWAFATTGAMEGAFALATGSLRSLSEQQLLDCAGGSFGNKGCQGGNFDGAYKYIINNTGLDSEDDYPYQALALGCWKPAAARTVASVSSFTDITPSQEAQLIAAAALGPVAVAVEADQAVFQSYKSGVMSNSSCGTKLDHGVLVVGYTADAWIVKNSWGDTWGDKGYIQLQRGVSPNGICGINMDPVQPVVPKGAPPPVPPPTPGPEPAGLPCNCTTSCESMCSQFGMVCCGDGVNCNCSSLSSCPKCKPPGSLQPKKRFFV